MPTFPKPDLKVATKPLYAGAGVTDLAVKRVRELAAEAQQRVAEAQQRVAELDLEPKALRDQATTVVGARVGFHLPYVWASMRIQDAGWVEFTSQRHFAPAGTAVLYELQLRG